MDMAYLYPMEPIPETGAMKKSATFHNFGEVVNGKNGDRSSSKSFANWLSRFYSKRRNGFMKNSISLCELLLYDDRINNSCGE